MYYLFVTTVSGFCFYYFLWEGLGQKYCIWFQSLASIDMYRINCCFVPFFIPGVLAFFVLLGFFGLILHCSAFNSNDPRMAGCQNCCYGWGILDCFPASMEACFALVIVFVVIFAILGIAYGFLAATMAIQRIWQRHYHILTKRELTKEYIVEDLHGCYTPPKLDAEHEERLKMLKLL